MAAKTSTSTKKPVRRRKDARPGEIVAAGIAEFAEHGFERARLDRIAKAAGIAKGTIYLYFESKDALFLAAVEEYIAGTMSESEQLASGFSGTTEELLRALLDRLYTQFLRPEHQAIMRILIAEGHRMPEVMTQYHSLTIDRGVGVLKAILQRGVDRGEVRPSAIIDHPQVMIAPSMFLALNRMMFTGTYKLDIEQYKEAHIEVILRGILAPSEG
ncbi:MAG: TetR/AcrR family transcriptional regulator [Shimia sp.]